MLMWPFHWLLCDYIKLAWRLAFVFLYLPFITVYELHFFWHPGFLVLSSRDNTHQLWKCKWDFPLSVDMTLRKIIKYLHQSKHHNASNVEGVRLPVCQLFIQKKLAKSRGKRSIDSSLNCSRPNQRSMLARRRMALSSPLCSAQYLFIFKAT